MPPLRRPLISAAVAAAAVLGGLLTGDALTAALLGALGGATALLAGRPDLFRSPAPPPAEGDSTDARRRSRALIDSVPDPLLLLGAGRVAMANPSARRLLGEWIEGQDVRLALRQPAVLERLSAPDPAPIEITGIGEPIDRPWLVTVAALDDGERLIHLADRSEAAAAGRMRVDFVANASHELRTPLATLLGFIETLQDDSAGGDSALRGRFLGLMMGEARRMQQLIDDLMSLSRIEADRFSAPADPVDLLSLAEEIRTACGQLLRERGAALEVVDESSGTTVPGDRGQLLQLLRNLVVNALKYGPAGADVTLMFEDESAQSVRMTVIDRGDGIAAEHLPRLTERFYRVDAGRSRALGGTGLGLAIVKHVVTRHRGRLDIRSAVGEGTRVAVSLPRAAAG
jgi:two-component system, OmpR family, phosphate regulon sensor histidine kinase PhoR